MRVAHLQNGQDGRGQLSGVCCWVWKGCVKKWDFKTLSAQTQKSFLSHGVVCDSEDYLWNLLNMQILPPPWVPLCFLPPSWNICGVPTVWSPWLDISDWKPLNRTERSQPAGRARGVRGGSHTQASSLACGEGGTACHIPPHPWHQPCTPPRPYPQRENLTGQSWPDGSWFRGAWHEQTQDPWFLLVGN